MTRHLLLATLCLLFSLQSRAEKPKNFSFDSTLVHRGSSVFSYVRVVDQRKHPEDIGIVRGGFGAGVPLAIHDKLSVSLFDFANHVLAGVKYSKPDTLLLVVYDFMLDQLPDASIGTFYLKAQIFSGSQNSYYLLSDIDSIYENNESIKALKAIPSNILFEQLRDIALFKTKALDSNRYTYVEACNKIAAQKSFPVYACNGNFKKGVYLTYSDFLNQTPSSSLFIQKDHYIENRIHKPVFYYQNERGKKGERVDSVFAIYNGEHWYLPKGSEWVRLKYEEGEFYRKQQFYGIKHVSKDAIGPAAVMFGLVGAITTAAIIEGISSGRKGIGVYEARLNPVTNSYKPVKRLF